VRKSTDNGIVVVLLYELRRKKTGQLFAKASYRSDCARAGVAKLQATNTTTKNATKCIAASHRSLGAAARDAGIYERANPCAIGPRANKTGINNVRFGSKADIAAWLPDVRFTPKADILRAERDVRFGPKADIARLFDHLVGAQQDGLG
jgi:hypothetical protein